MPHRCLPQGHVMARNEFKHRLRERTLDALDWLEIRPDPRPISWLLVPGIAVGGFFLVPSSIYPFLLAGATIVGLVLFLFLLATAIVVVLARTGRDIIANQRHTARLREAGPLIIHRRDPQRSRLR